MDPIRAQSENMLTPSIRMKPEQGNWVFFFKFCIYLVRRITQVYLINYSNANQSQCDYELFFILSTKKVFINYTCTLNLIPYNFDELI